MKAITQTGNQHKKSVMTILVTFRCKDVTSASNRPDSRAVDTVVLKTQDLCDFESRGALVRWR